MEKLIIKSMLTKLGLGVNGVITNPKYFKGRLCEYIPDATIGIGAANGNEVTFIVNNVRLRYKLNGNRITDLSVED